MGYSAHCISHVCAGNIVCYSEKYCSLGLQAAADRGQDTRSAAENVYNFSKISTLAAVITIFNMDRKMLGSSAHVMDY